MASRFGVLGVIVVGTAILVGAPQNAAAQTAPTGQSAAAAKQPVVPCGPNVDSKNVVKASRCFELRTYIVDSPATLDLLHSRFREYTMALLKKHGITVVGFWQPGDNPRELIYLTVYKDREARDKAWDAFNADPEWAEVRKKINVSPTVESIFMSATDYSPMK
jgi:hypothetical protein